MRSRQSSLVISALLVVIMFMTMMPSTQAWVTTAISFRPTTTRLLSSSTETATTAQSDPSSWDYEVPEDAVVVIKPSAMKRLRELRDQQGVTPLILRMVRRL